MPKFYDVIFKPNASFFLVVLNMLEVIANASFHYKHGPMQVANLPLFLLPHSFVNLLSINVEESVFFSLHWINMQLLLYSSLSFTPYSFKHLWLNRKSK